jgi:hypothetical protein
VEDLNIVTTMEFVWRRDNQDPALKKFVNIFRGEPRIIQPEESQVEEPQ